MTLGEIRLPHLSNLLWNPPLCRSTRHTPPLSHPWTLFREGVHGPTPRSLPGLDFVQGRVSDLYGSSS